MKLVFIDPQSYNNLSKYDVSYLQALDKSMFSGEIRFFCSKLLNQPVPNEVITVPVFVYNTKRTLIGKLLSYGWSVGTLLVQLFKHPATIYHLQWLKFPPLDLILIQALRRMTHGKVVLTAHNVVPHGEEHKRHSILGKIYRSVDRVFVHNESTALELATRFSVPLQRISIVAHGRIDLEPSGTAVYKARVEQFAERAAPCFLFIGRGSRYKGLDILLRAWRNTVAVGESAPGLMVIGRVDEELRADVRDAIADMGDALLVIDEHVSEADLYHAVQKCDAVILPYRSISQSGVLLSVLGLRVPVVVSSLPGLMEPLKMADIGWSFDGTETGLADVLTYLVQNREVIARARANSNGWALIASVYDWTKIAREAAVLYQALAGNDRTLRGNRRNAN